MTIKKERDRHQNKGFTLFVIVLHVHIENVSNVWSTLSLCYGRCICTRLNIFPHHLKHSLSHYVDHTYLVHILSYFSSLKQPSLFASFNSDYITSHHIHVHFKFFSYFSKKRNKFTTHQKYDLINKKANIP